MSNTTTGYVDFSEVLREATGKWPGILARFGVGARWDGKHGPCPLCGGTDRFRFDDKEGRGTWICNQCGAGDGIKLLMKSSNIDFKEACISISKVMGMVEKTRVNHEPKITPEKLKEVFMSSKPIEPGDPVAKYLRNRGLSDFPSTLRFCPECWEYETKQNQNAMLAVFSAMDGKAITIHRTFIKKGKKLDIKSPRKIMPSLEKMNGGAVRLYTEEKDTLGIAEGIETAIAVHEMFNITVWAVLSANLMESFRPSPWAKRVEIYADNDATYTGAKAAYTLANRLVVIEKIPATVLMAKANDFLDDLNNMEA